MPGPAPLATSRPPTRSGIGWRRPVSPSRTPRTGRSGPWPVNADAGASVRCRRRCLGRCRCRSTGPKLRRAGMLLGEGVFVMAGNSQRRGAMRKPGTKKGPVVGSGGQARRGLRGKGPTPPAENRTGHPARRAASRDAGGAKGVARARQGHGQGRRQAGCRRNHRAWWPRFPRAGGAAGDRGRPEPGGRGAARRGAGHRAVRGLRAGRPTSGCPRPSPRSPSAASRCSRSPGPNSTG